MAVVVYVISLAIGLVAAVRLPGGDLLTRAELRDRLACDLARALGATVAIGIVDYAFPAYLTSISTIARFGTTIVFVLIVLGWFYVLALIMLGGGIVNALRWHGRDHPAEAEC